MLWICKTVRVQAPRSVQRISLGIPRQQARDSKKGNQILKNRSITATNLHSRQSCSAVHWSHFWGQNTSISEKSFTDQTLTHRLQFSYLKLHGKLEVRSTHLIQINISNSDAALIGWAPITGETATEPHDTGAFRERWLWALGNGRSWQTLADSCR